MTGWGSALAAPAAGELRGLDGAVDGWLLPTLVGLPLAVAIVLVLARRLDDQVAVWIATVTSAITVVLSVLATLAAAPFDASGPGLEVSWSWIPALGVNLHLGLDGISAPLVILTAVLGLLVCWHALRVKPEGGSARVLVASFLAVDGGALATFTALDVVVFFLAFEIVLVPMWFTVAVWGDRHQKPRPQPFGPPLPGGEEARRDAANRFILFTAIGSATMLIGLLLVAVRTGTTDLIELAERGGAGMDDTVQIIAAALIVAGLAVKTPSFPLHTWLPPAHSIAPTGGSVLLAGVLLKMGTYGLVRVAVPVLPEGMRAIAPVLAFFGTAGILWAGMACFVERDLKRLIALSSVAHMGFVLLGIASMTPQGLQGALYANVAHGVITGLLFLTVGAIKDRHHHSADLGVIGSGLRDRLPRLGWLLAFGAIAGLGLPGLAGFWGELLAIAGAWTGTEALGSLAKPLAVAATLGTAVAAAYLLRVLRLIWHGPRPPGEDVPSVPTARVAQAVGGGDATRHELAVAAPLVLATVVFGILPWLLLDVTGPAVRLLLEVPGGMP